jgi:hypothetical protein
MCEVRSRKKIAHKKKYNDQQRKEMDSDEPRLTSNEKTQPIWWTERPTGALVAAGSLWPGRPTCGRKNENMNERKKIRTNEGLLWGRMKEELETAVEGEGGARFAWFRRRRRQARQCKRDQIHATKCLRTQQNTDQECGILFFAH